MKRVVQHPPLLIQDVYPLSPFQEGVLFECLQSQKPGLYVTQFAYRCEGTLDITSLRRAFESAIHRHAVLRSAFLWEDLEHPLQGVLEDVQPVIEEYSFETNPESCPEDEQLRRYMQQDRLRGFVYSKPPLFRIAILNISCDRFILLVSYHHLLLDGWSYALLIHEMFLMYVGHREHRPIQLSSPPCFGEFVERYREKNLAPAKIYWTRALSDLPPTRTVPPFEFNAGTRLVPDAQHHQVRYSFISSADWKEIEAVSRKLKVTSNTVTQAVWALLLSRYCGERDVVFGSTVSGRSPEIADIDSMVGVLVNTLPVRIRCRPGTTFASWVKQVQSEQAEARQHDYAPLADIQVWAGRSPTQPLFDALFVYEKFGGEVLSSLDLKGDEPSIGFRVVAVREVEAIDYPLALSIAPGRQTVLRLGYDSSLYSATGIDRMLRQYINLLGSAVHHPEKSIDYLPMHGHEQEVAIAAWSEGTEQCSVQTQVQQLVEEQAKLDSAADALIWHGGRMNFGEFNARANKLARYLETLGVGPEVRVAICLERNPEMLVALLGVLKAGGAYVPLDPEYPEDRLAYMLEDSSAAVLITSSRLRRSMPTVVRLVVTIDEDWGEIERESGADLNRMIQLDQLAYIIYTSGSTGRPKGVGLTHRGAANLAAAQISIFQLQKGTKVLQFASCSFDAAVSEWSTTLGSGGQLVLAKREELGGGELIELMRRERVEVATLPPSILEQMPEAELPDLRTLVVAGEACGAELVERWSQGRRMLNAYGPSETTVCATISEALAPSRDKVPIGKAIANTRVYVLDEEMRIVPVGVRGELYIGGVGVGRGYVNRPELTAERFVPDGVSGRSGERLYRSGDRVRWREDGVLEYLGRQDEQVKLRGYRIELEEIEAVLREQGGVRQCAVSLREMEEGEKYLAAYIVPEEGAAIDITELREQLKRRLPEYMIPVRWMEMERMPLTANGKLDRRALPEPEPVRQDKYEKPRTAVEQIVAGIWEQVLKRERIGRGENFFELGGHSLLATQVISRIGTVLGVDLPMRVLFDHAELGELAKEVDRVRAGSSEGGIPEILKVERRQRMPLSYAQQRLWFLAQLEPESTAYNITVGARLMGRLDVSALQKSFRMLVQRHESLRTVFSSEAGEAWQVIGSGVGLEINVVDIRGVEDKAAILKDIGREQAESVFELSRGPLIRGILVSVGDEEHVLLLSMHHIVSDGWSMAILVRELGALYEAEAGGKSAVLNDMKVQYADYAVWQREWLKGPVLEQQMKYWEKELAGAEKLDLPKDQPSLREDKHSARRVPFELEPELTYALKALCRREGITLFMALLSAYEIVLGRYAGQRDVLVGAAIANRNRLGTEDVVGFFVNIVLLRACWEPSDNLRTLLCRVRQAVLGAYSNQDLPFERLSELISGKHKSPNELLGALLNFENQSPLELKLGDVEVSPLASWNATSLRTDLDFYLSEGNNTLSGHLIYDPTVFEVDTICTVREGIKEIVRNMVDNLDLPIPDLRNLFTVPLPPLPTHKLGQLRAPLSHHQERMWFIDEFEAGQIYDASPTYHNIPMVVFLNGTPDPGVLQTSVDLLADRHESLRVAVIRGEDGGPCQLLRHDARINLREREISGPLGDVTADNIPAPVLEEQATPFTLSRGPLIRATLLRFADEKSVLVLVAHHFIADRQSLQLILQELAEIYGAISQGRRPELPALEVHHMDFCHWQRSLSDHHLARSWGYWREQLRDKIPALQLPQDHPRPAIHRFRPGCLSTAFPCHNQMEAGTDYSPEDMFLACLVLVLHKYSAQEEIVLGTSDPYRESRPWGQIVGPVANLLVLRNRIRSDDTLRLIINAVAKTLRDARSHSDMPFDYLVRKLNLENDMSRTALFDVLFQYQQSISRAISFGVISGHSVETNLGHGKYDLSVMVEHDENEIRILTVYNTILFDRSTIARMTEHYRKLIEEAYHYTEGRVGDLSLLTAAEMSQLVAWQGPEVNYPRGRTIQELFEQQASRTGGNIAVRCGTTELTYAELNMRANRLAHYLRSRGVGRGTMVGILLDRGVDLVIVILGILKAGGVYVPLEPSYPQQRLQFALESSATRYCLTKRRYAETLSGVVEETICIDDQEEAIASASAENPTLINSAIDLAYCLYTSGSTGRPNGVLIEHRNVIRLMINDRFVLGVGAADVWTMFHSYSFDFSVWEMYGALLYGGTVIVVPDELRKDPRRLAQLVKRERVTVLSQTPSYFCRLMPVLLEPEFRELELKYVIFGAEALHPSLLDEFMHTYPGIQLVNMYGITETTVHVTARRITGEDCEQRISNIGNPIPTTSVYVLDGEMKPVPVGVIGELYVGGEGLGRGYLNQPALTAQRFVPDAISGLPGCRLYRTGDTGKWREDGTLEFVGRVDRQVKLRGYRIELEEIEAVLREQGGVRQCAVSLREMEEGEKYLAAYIVPEEGAAIDITELREQLKRRLPEYMIPVRWMEMERMPLTANGKLDRRALPEPEPVRQDKYEKPRTAVEQIVAGIWEQVLKRERIGRGENFFELGGHSLLATQVMARIRRQLGADLPIRALFEHPTVGELAADVERARQGEKPQLGPIERAERGERMPLSYAQQRLWFLAQLDPHSAAYNIPAPVRLRGMLDIAALQEAIGSLVERHESLRTTFTVVGHVPNQRIHRQIGLACPLVDLSLMQREDSEALLYDMLNQDARKPFNLKSGPLFRAAIVRLDQEDHVLLFTIHHIICDGWSLKILIRDLSQLYDDKLRSNTRPLVVPPLQYSDFCAWERKWISGSRIKAQLGYWRSQLHGLNRFSLCAQSGEADFPNAAGARFLFQISREITFRLLELARAQGATFYMTLLAAFDVLLYLWSGNPDVAVGSPVGNRRFVELEDVVGLLLNQVVLRIDMIGDPSFRQVVDRVRATTLEAHANSDVPFEQVVRAVVPRRVSTRSPLFQVFFSFQDFPDPGSVPIAGLSFEPLRANFNPAKVELGLLINSRERGLECEIIYSSDLFTSEVIQSMAQDFQSILSQCVTNPEVRVLDLQFAGRSDCKPISAALNSDRQAAFSFQFN